MNRFADIPALGAATQRSYHEHLQKWLDLLPPHFHEHERLRFLLTYPSLSIRFLLRHLRDTGGSRPSLTHANLRHYLLPIVALLRYRSPLDDPRHYHTWMQIVDQVSQPLLERRLRQLPTPQQLERGGVRCTFADLIAARNRLGAGESAGGSAHLLLSMYTYLYPVRADYFATALLQSGEAPTTPNYVRWMADDAELVLRDFKTARVFGQIHHPRIGAELAAVIRLSLEKQPRKYLFVTARGLPYTRNSFSRWAAETLQDVMGVAMNLTIVRHLFISTLSMETAPIELTRIGNLMGHSITNQRLYKWVIPAAADAVDAGDAVDADAESDAEDEDEAEE